MRDRLRRAVFVLTIGACVAASNIIPIDARQNQGRPAPPAQGRGAPPPPAPPAPQGPTPGQPSPAADVRSINVQGNVWMLVGAGANIAMQVGDEGVLLVDTGATGMTDTLLSAIRRITDKPIRYICSTPHGAAPIKAF